MKNLTFSILIFLMLGNQCYGVPSNTLSITPTATSGTTITASDENSRNNTVASTYNAHGHTDITQVGTITSGTWTGTAIGTSYGGLGASVPGARVYNDAAISLSNDTNTALTFNTERFDNDTNHSTASNTGRLTATTAGKYIITGHVIFDSNATGRRSVDIRLNGSTQIATINYDIDSAISHAMSIATIYDMAATDYVELMAYQNSTGSLNVNATLNASPEFSMIYLGK